MEQGSRYDLSAVHSQDTKARQEQWKKNPSIQSIIRSKNPEHAGLSQAVKTCRTQVQHTINNKEHISDPTSEERGIYSQGTR